MNKRIGVVGWMTGPNSLGVTFAYADFIQQNFGELIIISPNSEDIVPVDLLILPGGADVDTARYNETPTLRTGKPNHFLEAFDRKMLPQYIEAGTPIVGICRGMQSLNVHFGGTLYQDLPHMEHASSSKDKRWERVNTLSFLTEDKPTPEVMRAGAYTVNSIHHQAVKDLGDNMTILAVCTDAKAPAHVRDTVEIIKHNTLPIYGFQYHPEEIWDDFSVQTINKLLKL